VDLTKSKETDTKKLFWSKIKSIIETKTRETEEKERRKPWYKKEEIFVIHFTD